MSPVLRRRFLIAAGSAAWAALAAVNSRRAHPQASMPRVVLLVGETAHDAIWQGGVDAFRRRLRELGYVEGKNLALDIRELGGQYAQLPAIMGEIVRSEPKVIVVSGSQAVKAAMAATSTIAIVTTSVGDPVEQGFAASLARPGKNLTGIAIFPEVTEEKALEIVHEIVPNMSRLAVLANPAHPLYDRDRKRIEATAAKRGLIPVMVHASRWEELPQAFADAVGKRADAVLVENDAVYFAFPKRMVDAAARYRIPTIYPTSVFVAQGGLVSCGVSGPARFSNAANFVDRILKGRTPAELPFERPTKFEVVVNLKAARALGLTIPQSVLLRADRVVE